MGLARFLSLFSFLIETAHLFPALQALAIQAKVESLANVPGNETQIQPLVQQLQTLVGSTIPPTPGLQLAAAHIYLQAGMKKEALSCVHEGSTIEHLSVCIQIYIMIDRLDLAIQTFQKMKRLDDDSILTQLGSVYISLATGSSTAMDAIHTLTQLSEQYGPSTFLLNLMACAYLQAGKYTDAESKLEQARIEFNATNDVDTIVNLMVTNQHQKKPNAEFVSQLQSTYPNHFVTQGIQTVQGAFERESIKYRV